MNNEKTREEKLGIKADRMKEHHAYYLELANAVGIGWSHHGRFMGRTISHWAALYQKDEHLNNVPLKEFDSFYPMHFAGPAMVAGSWSLCDTVCCLKAVIKDKVLAHLKQKNKGE